MELMVVGVVVLSILVFAPIRFAFARAGFRHPLLPAIPTGIAVFITVCIALDYFLEVGFELIVASSVVLLLLLVFAPIRFAFARAGFRHPLLLAIPTGIPVLIAAIFAPQLVGVHAVFILAVLAVLAVVVIYVAYSKFPTEGSQSRNANANDGT